MSRRKECPHRSCGPAEIPPLRRSFETGSDIPNKVALRRWVGQLSKACSLWSDKLSQAPAGERLAPGEAAELSAQRPVRFGASFGPCRRIQKQRSEKAIKTGEPENASGA